MKEAITWVHAKDVRVGDFVSGCSWPSGPKEVTEVSPDGKVICGSYGRLRPLGADVFLLHARPWPEGKTEAQWQRDIDLAINSVSFARLFTSNTEKLQEALLNLREVLKTYELGKASEAKKSPVSHRDVYDSNGNNRCLGTDD